MTQDGIGEGIADQSYDEGIAKDRATGKGTTDDGSTGGGSVGDGAIGIGVGEETANDDGGLIETIAEKVLAKLAKLIEKLETLVPKMSTEVQNAQTKSKSLFESLPGPLKKFFEVLGNWLVKAFQWIWDKIKWLGNWISETLFPAIKGPFTLWRTGTDWSDNVFSNVTRAAGKSTTHNMVSQNYWEGPAAAAYLRVTLGQKVAAEKVASIISKMRESIQGIALSLGAVYVGIIAGLLLALLMIQVGGASILSVIGIPPGVVTMITGLLKAIAVGGIGFAGTRELLNGTAEDFATLLEQRNDSQAFENGHWPKATKDLADGSMSDGNRSKWEYAF